MKKLIYAILLAAALPALAETCFFDHEEPAGMNKICYYTSTSGTVAITISAVALCPLTINR
jgi:hypothetical protein